MSSQQGDEVRALTMRKINTVSSTGSSDSYRVKVNLTLTVVKVSSGPLLTLQAHAQTSFSPAASTSTSQGGQEKKEPTASLQISGKVVEENEYVRLGAFHTLDLEGESPA